MNFFMFIKKEKFIELLNYIFYAKFLYIRVKVAVFSINNNILSLFFNTSKTNTIFTGLKYSKI